MDALDELNGKIGELCAIAERERERLLDELVAAPWPARPVAPEVRGEVARLALDYATWTTLAKQYADMLRRSDGQIVRAAIARVK